MNKVRSYIILCLLLTIELGVQAAHREGCQDVDGNTSKQFPTDTLNAERAKFIALNVIENFADLSQLRGEMGENYAQDFISLFTMNGSIPLDYIDADPHEYVSPESYVSEYVAAEINEPLATTTEILPGHTLVKEVEGSDNYSVTIYVERTTTKALSGEGYSQLPLPRKEKWRMVVLVYGYGGARIDQTIHLKLPTMTPWVFDLDYEFNLANASIAQSSPIIQGLDAMKLKSNNLGISVNYRFAPFRSPISEEPIKYYLKVAAGLDFTSYSSPGLSLSSETPDYLVSDQVIGLLHGTQLNDLIGEGDGDFILLLEDDFAEEKIRVTTIDLLIGAGYQMSERTAIEIGIGLIGKGSDEVSVRNDYTRWTIFQEYYFEDRPVTVGPNAAEYEGIVLEFNDIDDAYQLGSDANSSSYKVETSSSAYLDLKLIQSFDVGTLAVGGTFSIRSMFNSPLSQDENASNTLSDVSINGMPRLVSFTEGFRPFYIGLGLRIQKR